MAGQFGYFNIQAKDAFGNNQVVGGDTFKVQFNMAMDVTYQYEGNVDDNNDGTYTARYTIPISGSYTVLLVLQSTPGGVEASILSCISAYAPYIFSVQRSYNGLGPYTAPSFCQLQQSHVLKVLSTDLDAASCTYEETTYTYGGNVQMSLTTAVVGVSNVFYVQSRDSFGNLRVGGNTTHIIGTYCYYY